jgi:hypothetical protein
LFGAALQQLHAFSHRNFARRDLLHDRPNALSEGFGESNGVRRDAVKICTAILDWLAAKMRA